MGTARIMGGRYRLDTVLGSGGMSVVWRGHDEVLGRRVAIKLLSGRHVSDRLSRRRIRDEARMAATLSHPNVAQVYDFGETTGEDGAPTPFVVMELVPGDTLEQRSSAGPLPPVLVFRWCAQIAAALSAAHASGLVHRDIKPANILVASGGVKVVDFGIAAAVSAIGPVEPDVEILGTPAYLAPERLTTDTVEPASDVYSLGVLLYKLLVGRLPWSAATTTQLLTDHVFTEPEPLPEITGVPDEVARLCLACLAKDPVDRPAASVVAEVLAGAAGLAVVPAETADEEADQPDQAINGPGDQPDVVPEDTTVAPGGAKAARRWRAVAAIALIALACALLAVWQSTRARPGGSGVAGAPAGTAPAASAGLSAPAGSISPMPSAAGNAGPIVSAAGPGWAAPVPLGSAPSGAEPGPPVPPPESTPTAAPTAAPPPPPATTTLTSAGGSVRADCTSTGLARLLSWTPNRGYRVDSVNAGPASTATIDYQHGKSIVHMAVTCTDGQPSATVT